MLDRDGVTQQLSGTQNEEKFLLLTRASYDTPF